MGLCYCHPGRTFRRSSNRLPRNAPQPVEKPVFSLTYPRINGSAFRAGSRINGSAFRPVLRINGSGDSLESKLWRGFPGFPLY